MTVVASPTVPQPPGLDDGVLERLCDMVYRESAIVLGPEKAPFIRARLAKRIRQLEVDGVDGYVEVVEGDSSGREMKRMINLITTHETSFFRETEHFDFLARDVVPQAAKLKIWSAGCASGEEPYSIAITVLQARSAARPVEAEILATDISSAILAKARAGEYTADSVARIDPATHSRFFSTRREPSGPVHRVRPEVRSMVFFAELNLLHAWPMRGPFDVIFCRNVMIYFDRPFQLELARRFTDLLRPGGYLCIGHAESLGSNPTDLELIRPALYRRVENRRPR